MPSATPLPRGPSVLVLDNAADLLTRAGCPVCRYAAEASDRHLGWFALEAHADPVTITRLCATLGMCPRHTRALMSQPGAASRLTPVYRYLIEAARQQLAGPAARPAALAPCPACEHDEAAAGRALDTLLEGLEEPGIRERYLELGGLCVPHLRAAARVRGRRRALAWLAQTLNLGTSTRPPSLEMLAGGPDRDADQRAMLRAALPPAGHSPPGACPVCLAAARSEGEALARPPGSGDGRQPACAAGGEPGHRFCLCGAHVRDAVLAGRDRAGALLAGQADCQATSLPLLLSSSARRGGNPAGWLRRRHSRPGDAGECPVCRARAACVRRELDRCLTQLRAPLPARGGEQTLCVRHVLALRRADPAAARVAALAAAEHAGALTGELAEAFRKGTWAHRHEARGRESGAWRRAAAFLDGGVFGGCPPGER